MQESSTVAGCTINMCKINRLEGHATSAILFFSQIHNPSLVARTTLDKPKMRGGHSAKRLTSTPQNCHGREISGKIKELSQTGGD